MQGLLETLWNEDYWRGFLTNMKQSYAKPITIPLYRRLQKNIKLRLYISQSTISLSVCCCICRNSLANLISIFNIPWHVQFLNLTVQTILRKKFQHFHWDQPNFSILLTCLSMVSSTNTCADTSWGALDRNQAFLLHNGKIMDMRICSAFTVSVYWQTWENYVHVRNRARNVHVKIYDAHEMYVHVTYCTNKWFFNFAWLTYLYFCILAHRFLTIHFIYTFFSYKYKNIVH